VNCFCGSTSLLLLRTRDTPFATARYWRCLTCAECFWSADLPEHEWDALSEQERRVTLDVVKMQERVR
jgi:hypothetical protein